MAKHKAKFRIRKHPRKRRPGEHAKREERRETRQAAQQVWEQVDGPEALGTEHRHHRPAEPMGSYADE